MSADLRELARLSLEGHPSPPADAELRRAVLEVAVDGREELVTLSSRDGRLVCVSSDGDHQGAHALAALRMLAGVDEGRRHDSIPGAERPASSSSPGTESVPPAPRSPVGEALLDVLTAVLRLGAREAHGSPSVEDTLDRLVEAAPKPTPLGLARFVGRLRQALAGRDVERLSRLLDGATRLSADLEQTTPSADARVRVGAWLGSGGGPARDATPVYDRTLVEVGREWVAGLSRASIERRYLIDTASGAVCLEERQRGAEGASVGPCPRRLAVGLAEEQRGAAPTRARLLQYVVSPEVGGGDLTEIEGVAARDFAAVGREYRAQIKAFPALAEPFVVVAPAALERDDDGGLVPVDAAGLPLPLARQDDPGAYAMLGSVAREHEVAWLAGRLVDTGGSVLLLPFAAAVRERGTLRFRRLR